MGIKEKWYKKIQKNCFESELEYVDKKGNIHKETVFFKRSLLPIWGDWGRINPPFEEDENGNVKTKWINLIFGGWKNFITLVFILIIVGMVLIQFRTNYTYIDYLQNIPCVRDFLNQTKIDVSNLNLTIK
jgi:hypothetical protein